ncbi:hypothetical protein ACJMK2_027473 [Sinanodonta woodiana]|uniref:Polyprotein n=1 Tax=Sinanodonta woodiana TaxID=1069815 RepID=A0ABD3XRC7_SINWO
MLFWIKSWYRDNEKQRKCSECNKIGYEPWDCAEKQPTKEWCYAATAARTLEKITNKGMDSNQEQSDKWQDIITKSKMPHKTPCIIVLTFITYNPFEALAVEETKEKEDKFVQTLQQSYNPNQLGRPHPG